MDVFTEKERVTKGTKRVWNFFFCVGDVLEMAGKRFF